MTQHIDNTVVIFTPTTTSIGDISLLSAYLPSTYLRIHVISEKNGKNLHNIKISYANAETSTHLVEEIKDENILHMITFSMRGEDESLYDRVMEHLGTLEDKEIAIIEKEYRKYGKVSIINGFAIGVATYLTFLLLQENNAFIGQMPFQFATPVTVESANSVNHNMFQYLSLPLTALANIVKGLQMQLVTFVQTFINIWDPAFLPGPIIGMQAEARLCMEVVSGISQYTSIMLAKARDDAIACAMQEMTECVRERVKCEVKESLKCEMKEYVDKALADALAEGIRVMKLEKQHVEVRSEEIRVTEPVVSNPTRRNYRIPRQRTFNN